jgi:uncharacterized membrane protein (DUF485 family)
MTPLDHGSHPNQRLDDPATAARNARLGLWLFVLYLLLYSGFVGLNAFAPQWMETTPVAGINLAILYGMGLIIAALVLALVYGWLCRLPVHSHGQEERR